MPPSQVDIAGSAGKAVIKVVHRCTDATENQNLGELVTSNALPITFIDKERTHPSYQPESQ